MRQGFTIKQTSQLYSLFSIVSTVLSFTTSFAYAYFAAFLYRLTPEEQRQFYRFDQASTYFFIVDIVLNIFVDEHDPTTDGVWTALGSIRKQLNWSLFLNVFAILPLSNLLSPALGEREANLLYSVKVVRLMNGFVLIDYKRYKQQFINA
mmetsp:Transcript_42684/g.65489  ORF Transcript_42684/g.65489 Transcript_42684/m.65489 type:complete len:150 (+) Transcript_42684:801-1250(+)